MDPLAVKAFVDSFGIGAFTPNPIENEKRKIDLRVAVAQRLHRLANTLEGSPTALPTEGI